MDFITAIILGIVEGVTEFLPISSTGHLVIVNQWLSFSPDFTKMFDVIIQLGAILAVLAHFRSKLRPPFVIWKKAIVAVIPALVLGALFGSAIEAALFNPDVVAGALIIGGAILVLVEKRTLAPTITEAGAVGYKKALYIGLAQCLALIPGTSRSAASVIGARLLGMSRPAAAEFSFFLAVPTMLAASGYSLLKHGIHMTGHEAALLVTGFVVSFVVAWAVIGAFMRFIQTRSFASFGWYRIVLGAIVLLFLAR
ncbi:MAG TPA: undecaprenyl-diphosphate phosphatase [Candidatus Paceibacterota bacterium]|nr:undecaprenyl-diphosphate phosphatase [Candidatus Paceibacterota bacterium]